MSTRTQIGSALAALALAVMAAGCGGSSPTTTSAGAQSGPGPGNGIQAAYHYARCMRAHGVSNFPDPKVVHHGNGIGVGFHVGPWVGTAHFKSAQKACQSILPGPSQGPSPQQQAAHLADLLSFVRCLRAHGLSNFPDPTPEGHLTPQMLQQAGVDLHAPDVRPAARACIGASHGAVTMAAVNQAINGGG